MNTRSPLIEFALRDIEGKLEDTIDVAKLRRDQVLMYALLGDPATRLKLPHPLEADFDAIDGGWRWRVTKPSGAEQLHVGFRPHTLRLPEVNAGSEQARLRATFEAANNAYAFSPVAVLEAGDAWEGVVREQGRLRLLATGPGVFSVAVFDTGAKH